MLQQELGDIDDLKVEDNDPCDWVDGVPQINLNKICNPCYQLGLFKSIVQLAVLLLDQIGKYSKGFFINYRI